MPSLANICLSRDFWALRKFLHLRAVYFSKTGKNKWQTLTMLDFNKSHLQTLVLEGTFSGDLILQMLAQECPELKRLCVVFDGTHPDVTIANFTRLEFFSFSTNFDIYSADCCRLNVHIVNMPCLIECQILDADFTMLHFGMNVACLQRVSSMESGHTLLELIFDDIVPQLYYIDFGESGAIRKLDPFNKVNWNKVKVFSFSFTECCHIACSQLCEIETLMIGNAQNLPDSCIPWPKLNKLQRLEFENPTTTLIESCFWSMTCHTNLTELFLHWTYNTIVDFRMFVPFINLTAVSLHGTKYVNFHCLFLLKKLQKYFNCMLPLTNDEQEFLALWRAKIN